MAVVNLFEERKDKAVWKPTKSGKLCLAGVYTADMMQGFEGVMAVVSGDVAEWCRRQMVEKVFFESDDDDVLSQIKGGVNVRVGRFCLKSLCCYWHLKGSHTLFLCLAMMLLEILFVIVCCIAGRGSLGQKDGSQQQLVAVCSRCSSRLKRIWDPGGCSKGIKLSMRSMSIARGCRSMKSGVITPFWADWLPSLSGKFGIQRNDLAERVVIREGQADQIVWKPTRVGRNNSSCGFYARNSRGMFCVAGVYSSHDGADLKSLIGKMLHDCIEWCRHMNVGSVYFETEDWRGVSWSGDNYPDIRIHTIKCAERVNCVVRGLVNSCTGGNVMFLRKEGLPQGLGRLLALEGLRLEWIGLSCCSLLLSQGELKVGWNILAVNCGWDGCHEAEDG
nr:uncharacterized protein LOC109147873 [Ipomoea batatas]